MTCPVSLVLVIMTATAMISFMLGSYLIAPLKAEQQVSTETACSDGRFCPTRWRCCEQGCCAPATELPPHTPHTPPAEESLLKSWPVLFATALLIGVVVWCCRCAASRLGEASLSGDTGVHMYSVVCCERRASSARESAVSVYPPPGYSRCGSFYQPPPPYSEVTSKPDLFPLVISYGDSDAKSSGNYLQVHYFRNYALPPTGSPSATSTAESLNSNFLYNVNEENTIIPPPYSRASNYDEYQRAECARSMSSLCEVTTHGPPRSHTAPATAYTAAAAHGAPALPGHCRSTASATFRENLMTSPLQTTNSSFEFDVDLDCEFCSGRSSRPQLGPSPPIPESTPSLDRYIREQYGVEFCVCGSEIRRRVCQSPPQPTSPTQSKESSLPRRVRRSKRSLPVRKLSLLPSASSRSTRLPGVRLSSRSAPTTPSGALPNLLSLSQRSSRQMSRSSRFDEESDPLLDENGTDHKF